MIRIHDAAPADETRWRALWDGYNRFYQATVADDVTSGLWRRLLDPDSGLFCRLAAQDDGLVVGFSICVMHAGTWSLAPVCYLEDLFVDPAARGAGAGAALIQDLIDRGRTDGWRRLYWHTRSDNITARKLYDRFVKADDFVRYDIDMR